MNKRILLIGYNYDPEPTGIGKYNGEMVSWLANHGYDCTVITTYPYYPYWKVQEPYYKDRFWYKTESLISELAGKIEVHRCPMYVPKKPSGCKRILLDISFFITAFIKLIQLIPSCRFDFIITVVPSFHFGLLGILFKKHFKAKLQYHIQDLQIEAARDLRMINSKLLISYLLKIEKYILKQSDVISSISDGMIKKVKDKIKKDVYLLPNWTDTIQFYPIENRGKLKKDYGFDQSDKIIVYSGAIGEKQGLEAIIYAAKRFEQEKNIKFVICGSGPYKEVLEHLAESLNLHNIIFYPIQPFKNFNLFLNLADVHLVIQKSSAGDLVLPSKLTNIMAVGGLALVTAYKGTSLHSCVSNYKIGILVEPDNQECFNSAIKQAITEDYCNIKYNARCYAEEHLSIDNIMGAYQEKCLEPNNIFANNQEYIVPVNASFS